MPSQSLQSLIDTFETLDASSPLRTPPLKPTSPPPLKPAGRRSFTPGLSNVIRDATQSKASSENPLDSPLASPTADSLSLLTPMKPTPSSSRSNSPANLGRKSSLVDLGEFSYPNAGQPNKGGKPYMASMGPTPRAKPAPPLPPRRVSSSSSAKSAAPSTPSNNLKVSHCYPPRAGQGKHAHASSTSSFHSVSLSSEGGNRDSMSVDDDSIEVLSLSTAATTVSPRPSIDNLDMQSSMVFVPQLPPRPTHTPVATKRRAPPPPPPTFAKPRPTPQDSKPTLTSRSDGQVATQIPMDPKARERYISLFERNLAQQSTPASSPKPATRPSRAWRGPSMDLTTVFRSAPPVPDRTRLHGQVVKAIWDMSKLNRFLLRRIWAECNLSLHGSLDKESFVNGMWMIDEELRRFHQQGMGRQPRHRRTFLT